MEHTLLLEVPEDVYESLLKMADLAGKSPEALVVQWLAKVARSMADDPVEKFIGIFSSHIPDWADKHDKYLVNAIRETMVNEES
jgi:hypothetical protein